MKYSMAQVKHKKKINQGKVVDDLLRGATHVIRGSLWEAGNMGGKLKF